MSTEVSDTLKTDNPEVERAGRDYLTEYLNRLGHSVTELAAALDSADIVVIDNARPGNAMRVQLKSAYLGG